MVNKEIIAVVKTELLIIIVASSLVSIVYTVILPDLFHGYATYDFLLVGVLISLVFGAIAPRRLLGSSRSWLWCSAVGLLVGTIVFLVSIGVIVSVRGS